MRNVFDLEPTTRILRDGSYIASYPHLLSYFASRDSFGEEDVVRGAHMAYGWMPTILELYPEPPGADLLTGARLLTKAKNSSDLQDAEIEKLAALVNNSLVGASKLLHFVAPQRFAIWDSKIYAFVFDERPHNKRMKQVSKYRHYLSLLNGYQLDPRFPAFHAAVNAKTGYAVSPLRALELVMFLNSPTLEV